MGGSCSAPGGPDAQEVLYDSKLGGSRGHSFDGGDGGGSFLKKDKPTDTTGVSEWQAGKERAREWQRQIKQETRQLDRDVNNLHREEEKLKRQLKQMANKGQMEQVHNVAKNIVQLRRSVARLERTKASMTAMNLHLTTQIASMSSASAVKVSTAMMKEANQIVNVQEMQKTMEEMQGELAKAHFAEEVMEDALEEPDAETEIDSELQKVYDEVALDASMLMRSSAPAVAAPTAQVALAPEHGDAMQTRLPQDALSTRLPVSMAEGDDPFGTRLQALSQ